MKNKLNPFYFLLALFIFSSFFRVSAAALTLTKIGAMDLGGKKYAEWWYTLENPTLKGTGPTDEDIDVQIDDKAYVADSDSSGNWTLATTMAYGDHSIIISAGTEKYSFKLHLAKQLPATLSGTSQPTTSATVAGVPTTGNDQAVALGLGVGLTLLASYLYISGDSSDKARIERKIVEG